MRQEVYAKFAEAVRGARSSRGSAARHALVQVKLAAAVALLHVSKPEVKAAQQAPSAKSIQTSMQKWMTPSNVGGAIARLGGTYLLGKSLGLTPGKVLGAGLGAGLLYGGYQLFKNPYIRELVDFYGNKAINYLGSKFGA